MSEKIPPTAYHRVKEDVLDILAALEAQVTHKNDGTVLGDKGWGFFLGDLYAESKRWHHVRERRDAVARLDGVIAKMRDAICAAIADLEVVDPETRDVPRALSYLFEAVRAAKVSIVNQLIEAAQLTEAEPSRLMEEALRRGRESAKTDDEKPA